MQTALIRQRAQQELRGIGLAVLLVGATTLIIFGIVAWVGLTRGSVVYLVPVVIAAVRWGQIPALVAGGLGVVCSAYFFYPPAYSLVVTDPEEVVNLILYVFCAIMVGQLASRLKNQYELSRQREIDLADLYAFSRRLAGAFDVSEIHAAIGNHLASVMQRRVLLFASGRDAGEPRATGSAPEAVLGKVEEVSAGGSDTAAGATISGEHGELWLVRAVSPKDLDYGVLAINLGRAAKEEYEALRSRLDTVLSDATATLERLGVAHAITEARMRAQTDRLREGLIGSVSHELRTPLASILGAATVLAAAPSLQNDARLRELTQGMRDEAERLNNDIQNLLDATRISSDGVRPHIEWADPADILHAALDRCRRRLANCRLAVDIPQDLPLIRVDQILLQQALVQILDNAVKYSPAGSEITVKARAGDGQLTFMVSDKGAGLTEAEQAHMWDRFARGERHVGTTSGSGLGLWIAASFVSANGGSIAAQSAGPGRGTTISVNLPVTQAAVPQLESDADE